MIRSFRDSEAENLFNDEFSKKYRSIERIGQRKLTMLDQAETLPDLAVLPGNCLEGGRKGRHSIRINDQYPICFTWADGDAHNVGVVDYH